MVIGYLFPFRDLQLIRSSEKPAFHRFSKNQRYLSSFENQDTRKKRFIDALHLYFKKKVKNRIDSTPCLPKGVTEGMEGVKEEGGYGARKYDWKE